MMHDSTRLKGLDGLRGIAILLVVVYHFWTEITGHKTLPNGSPWTFLYAGNTGVTLFFILSGFLVGLPFIKGFARGQLPSVRLYAAHRILRILPPYYFVGVIGILVTGQTQQLLPMLFFFANAFDVGYFSIVWWSLFTEVQFYLLLPIFFVVIARSRHRPPLIFAIGLLLTFLHLMVVLKLFSPALDKPNLFELKFRLILSILGQLPAFLVGLLLALLFHRYPIQSISQTHGVIGLFLLVLALGVALFPQAKLGALHFLWSAPYYIWIESALWGGIVWLLLKRTPPPFSILDNKLTRHLGKISFSLYLLHMPILQLVIKHLATKELLAHLLIASFLSVITAQISYLIVERPFLKLKSKLSPPSLSTEVQS